MVISKKQLYKISSLVIVFLFVTIVFLPSAFAGAISDFPQYMLNTINNGVIDTIRTNLTSNGGQNKFYNLMVSSDAAVRSAAIGAMMNATYAISMLMVLIISFTRYFQQLDKGADPKESLYKTLSSVFMIGIIVVNIDIFLGYVVQIGEWFIEKMTSLSNSTTATAITLEQITGKSSGGALWWMESVMILIIPWILSLLMCIVAQFIAFSILIELGVRKAFAPFAIVDIYSEGMRSPGMRYLKRYLATFLKIAVCLLVCYLGIELMGISAQDNIANFDSLGDCLQYIFRIIAINFTVLGVMAKAGEYANDVVGA